MLEIFNGNDWLRGFVVIWQIGEPAPIENEIIAASAHRLSFIRSDTLTIHSIPLKLESKTSKKRAARKNSKPHVNENRGVSGRKPGTKVEEHWSVDQIANALSSIGSVRIDKK